MHMPKLTIIGCGPGNPNYLLPIAKQKALEQNLLIGKKIFLDLFPQFPGRKEELLPLKEQLPLLKKYSQQIPTGLLVSGSPLHFSLAGLVIKEIGKENCELIPGISVVDVALAKLGLSRDRLFCLSFHGRRPALDLEEIRKFKTWFFFLDNSLDWLNKYASLLSLGTFFYLENLTLAEERIIKINTVQKLPQVEGPAVLVGSTCL